MSALSTIKMPLSAIRQNFSERCEALINKQINMELHASYVYMAMVRMEWIDLICPLNR